VGSYVFPSQLEDPFDHILLFSSDQLLAGLLTDDIVELIEVSVGARTLGHHGSASLGPVIAALGDQCSLASGDEIYAVQILLFCLGLLPLEGGSHVRLLK
jgi:hypothetical protein